MQKRREVRKKTIRGRLLTAAISIIAVSLTVVGGIAAYMNYASTISSLEQTMVETVKLAAHTVTHEMEGYERLAIELANNPVFLSETATREEILKECEDLAKRNGLVSVGIGDKDGTDLGSGSSLADREYFTALKQGVDSYVSDPVIRRDTGDMNVMISAPIVRAGQFYGIVYLGIDASALCEIVSGIQIGTTGNASLINGGGDTIGYKDVQLVLDAYNTQEELKNDKELAQLAAVERRLMAGETGFDEYSYGGVGKFAAFAPVEGTPGWGIYVAVAKDEFLNSTYTGIIVVLVLLAAFVVIGSLLMLSFSKSIVGPINLCVDRIRLLSAGDIHSSIPEVTTGDETQILADSMRVLVDNMNQVIGDIDYCLKEMAGGNFRLASRAEESYVGDFSNIKVSVNQLKDTLSDTLMQIMESSNQVSMGAEQMSQNAQSLAEGATEQASAVEELTATIVEIANDARSNADSADAAYENVMRAAQNAEVSNEEMKELTVAMERISTTSRDIKEIINTIEDIASQTNLLSLNASIEAARAGEAGRGFAVVAEQIGKLASDSAQSAVSTKQLIERSLQEIGRGNEITDQAVNAFETIIEEMKHFAEIANGSSSSSKTQASTLQEVEKGIEQISQVVQSNSAAAEETSATSEELSAQSESLNTLVNRFRC